MPRPNRARSLGSERAVAERISQARAANGWTYEQLAQLMSEAGCAIQPSAVYKIEKGDPPRRVTVDEAVALANVLDMSLDDLTMPTELVKQLRAQELAKEMPKAMDVFEDAVINGLRLYLEYGRLTNGDPDMLEYTNHQAERVWQQKDYSTRLGVDLGDGVTEEELADFRRDLIMFWGRTLRLASKAALGRTD